MLGTDMFNTSYVLRCWIQAMKDLDDAWIAQLRHILKGRGENCPIDQNIFKAEIARANNNKLFYFYVNKCFFFQKVL